MASPLDAALPVLQDMVMFAWQRLKRSLDSSTRADPPSGGISHEIPPLPSPPSLPELPRLPALPELPSLLAVSPSLPTMRPPPAAGNVAASYAAEFDTAIACVPCTRGHLSAMAIAAQEAARADEDRAARAQLLRVAGEALVMRHYDWTPEKLARARPADRAAIEEIRPAVEEILAALPPAPHHLVLAWAAVDESLRFARSPRPSDQDRQQVELRLRDAEAWLNYAEREALAPQRLSADQMAAARRALPLIREARHRLVSAAGELEALELVAARLHAALIELTPSLDAEARQHLAARCRECRDRFYARILANMRARRAG